MSNQTGPSACPPGWGPDLMYRFPLEPYFPEPYAQDCYLSYTGYAIMGSLVLAAATVCLFANLLTIPGEKNALMRYLRMMHVLQMCGIYVVVLVGWLRPEQYHIVMILFLTNFQVCCFMWLYAGYKSLVSTVANVEMNRSFTLVSMLGGPFVAFGFTVVLVLCFLTTFGAGLALSLAMWQTPEPNVAQATLLYRIMCAAVSGLVIVFISSSFVVVNKFVVTLEAVIKTAAKGGKLDEIKDVVTRFKTCRLALLVASPLGIVAWVIQAAILPMFWYIVLLHMFNVFHGCIMVWYSITSRQRRKEAVETMVGRGSIVGKMLTGVSDRRLTKGNHSNGEREVTYSPSRNPEPATSMTPLKTSAKQQRSGETSVSHKVHDEVDIIQKEIHISSATERRTTVDEAVISVATPSY